MAAVLRPGTNLQVLMEQAQRPSSAAHIVLVISNRPGALGLKRATLAGIQARVHARTNARVHTHTHTHMYTHRCVPVLCDLSYTNKVQIQR